MKQFNDVKNFLTKKLFLWLGRVFANALTRYPMLSAAFKAALNEGRSPAPIKRSLGSEGTDDVSGLLPEVAGRMIPCSNREMERRFKVYLMYEQRKHDADSGLIACLCDGVRLVREYNDYWERNKFI